MNLTNKSLLNLINRIGELKSKKMPFAISRSLILTHKAAMENYAVYEEQLKALFEEYASRDKDGNIVCESNGLPKIDSEQIQNFNTALNELLDLSININECSFDPLVLDNWDDNKYDVLTPDELEILMMLASS